MGEHDVVEKTEVVEKTKTETPESESHHKPEKSGHGSGHGHHGGHPVIIIKKIKKNRHAHHGGAWKIAYADFVTAMMAFFLMMWLISMLNKYQLQGVSEYFKTPLKESYKNQVSEKLQKQGIDKPPAPLSMNKTQEQKKDQKQLSMEQMKVLKSELENKLKNDKSMDDVKQNIDFVVTGDGLKIHIHDLEGKPMFSMGQTDFATYAAKIFTWLSKQIQGQNNRIMIVGHTDANPYHGKIDYTNWELSTDRANAVRRELVKLGIDEARFLRVAGSAEQDKLNNKNSLDAANRRIEIILMTQDASEKILKED